MLGYRELKELKDILKKQNMYETEDGEVFNIELQGDKIVAGGITNSGIFNEVELDLNQFDHYDSTTEVLSQLASEIEKYASSKVEDSIGGIFGIRIEEDLKFMVKNYTNRINNTTEYFLKHDVDEENLVWLFQDFENYSAILKGIASKARELYYEIKEK